MQVIKQNQIKRKIIILRDQKVIIDTDVAELYGVETKHVIQAVKNNPEKFPNGYIFELSKDEWKAVKSKFLTSPLGGGKTKRPKAFTEKGLYMLATILKSAKAVETTIAIIDTFAKVNELSDTLYQAQSLAENSPGQRSMMEHAGELISDLLIPENELELTGMETSYEVNFAIFKVKRVIKKGK